MFLLHCPRSTAAETLLFPLDGLFKNEYGKNFRFRRRLLPAGSIQFLHCWNNSRKVYLFDTRHTTAFHPPKTGWGRMYWPLGWTKLFPGSTLSYFARGRLCFYISQPGHFLTKMSISDAVCHPVSGWMAYCSQLCCGSHFRERAKCYVPYDICNKISDICLMIIRDIPNGYICPIGQCRKG